MRNLKKYVLLAMALIVGFMCVMLALMVAANEASKVTPKTLNPKHPKGPKPYGP